MSVSLWYITSCYNKMYQTGCLLFLPNLPFLVSFNGKWYSETKMYLLNDLLIVVECLILGSVCLLLCPDFSVLVFSRAECFYFFCISYCLAYSRCLTFETFDGEHWTLVEERAQWLVSSMCSLGLNVIYRLNIPLYISVCLSILCLFLTAFWLLWKTSNHVSLIWSEVHG